MYAGWARTLLSKGKVQKGSEVIQKKGAIRVFIKITFKKITRTAYKRDF